MDREYTIKIRIRNGRNGYLQELTAAKFGMIKTASRFDRIEATIVIKKLLADKEVFAA